MEDLGEFMTVLLVVGLIVGMVFGVGACVSERVYCVSSVPEIEQLRKDLGKVTAQRSEDAVGQATQWNQVIARKKRWNRVPFLSLWIPDGWDAVKEIQIPE